MAELRDRVAAELARYLRTIGLDNPWTDRRDAASRWKYSADGVLYSIDRLKFHEALVAESRSQSKVKTDGTLAAVVTAGPPGAGKTTALLKEGRFEGYRQIDADEFKDRLLLDSSLQDQLAPWLETSLLDSRPVAPRELSSFVHAESTAIADAMRDACLADGENIVIHGTLSSTSYIDDLLTELDRYGYERLVIFDVEVPIERAVEQALNRWWQLRESGEDPLGGRFIAPAAIRSYYPISQPGRAVRAVESITAENARHFRDRASDLGWDVELVSRDQPA